MRMPYHPDDDRLTQTSAWQNPQHWPGLDPRCAACWANGWTCETGEAQAELDREEENNGPPLCLCGHEETEHPLLGGCAGCGCLGYDGADTASAVRQEA